MQQKSYISYSPDKQGSIFALFYFESSADLYGWHLEAREAFFSAGFFLVENFYAETATHLYRSAEDDVYGDWAIDFPPCRDLIRCPLPDSVAHELERLQSIFVEEWFFFADLPHIEAELAAYRVRRLPVQSVNIKSKRLNRLQREGRLWVYSGSGLDLNFVTLLRRYWRMSEKIAS